MSGQHIMVSNFRSKHNAKLILAQNIAAYSYLVPLQLFVTASPTPTWCQYSYL